MSCLHKKNIAIIHQLIPKNVMLTLPELTLKRTHESMNKTRTGFIKTSSRDLVKKRQFRRYP